MLKASEYRCTEPCNNCPLMDDGKAMHLAPGRVDEIKEILLRGDNFVCHKTRYDLDENMEDTEPQESKMCYGAYKFLKDRGRPNQLMQIAERLIQYEKIKKEGEIHGRKSK